MEYYVLIDKEEKEARIGFPQASKCYKDAGMRGNRVDGTQTLRNSPGESNKNGNKSCPLGGHLFFHLTE